MRYDGYGTSSFGGGLIFLAIVIGGTALAVIYLLAHIDSIKSALADGTRAIIRGTAFASLFAAGGTALAAALALHAPGLAANGQFWYLAAFMALMLANGYRIFLWIRRRR